ncbi:conserved hypothetical protein [Leishmania infantum JPCM5]|uniref:Uncharacterized protein n=2 Tax=Leishmania infantum TaxID=5671 RepID=A4IA20_LEIIN|nr:conserved hypothetical protein [Leishmania infantum JPCM5]CAC9539178.1 hypothetical_protein_-_conserved [Leishmania infantum]CAM71676.1 conserved hypothetical protein [Leishmania infantum JPCM5]SUZ45610.1 hypothetical_protein_-_conserved [Leishmania infantum]|eukprot:XP_001468589.1 conserved hypothetical protein [Leishmania infantum JPCM5]
MLRESASSSQGGEGGGGGLTGENAFSRSAFLPAWVPPEASTLHQRSASLTPQLNSTTCSPLLGLRRSNASKMAGHGDDGLRGAGASASPQPPLGNPRFGLSPQRASTSLNMPSPPLSSMYYSPQVPPAQCSGLSITPTVASFMSSSSSHSPTAARVLMSAAASQSPSRRPVRLALGAFCMLNAVIAFLFTWMMCTQQIGFALTAAKRRWDLKERSGATCTAGVYYLIIGLVLLIDRLSSTVAVVAQLGVRLVRAGFPSILRWLMWCVSRIAASRVCVPLLRRLAPHAAIASSENYRMLMRSKSARPLRSSSAAVPAVGAPTALSGHGLLPRFSCSQMGSSFQCSQTNSMRESMADSEVDRRPCSATAASLSIRRRGG